MVFLLYCFQVLWLRFPEAPTLQTPRLMWAASTPLTTTPSRWVQRHLHPPHAWTKDYVGPLKPASEPDESFTPLCQTQLTTRFGNHAECLWTVSLGSDVQLLAVQDLRQSGVRRGDHGGLDGRRLQPQQHLSLLRHALRAVPQRAHQGPEAPQQPEVPLLSVVLNVQHTHRGSLSVWGCHYHASTRALRVRMEFKGQPREVTLDPAPPTCGMRVVCLCFIFIYLTVFICEWCVKIFPRLLLFIIYFYAA